MKKPTATALWPLFALYLLLVSFRPALAQPVTRIQYLSGTDKDHTVNWDFYIDKGMNSGKWTTIPVPSNWELQGFGVYNYGHRSYGKKQPPSDETGQYRHRFQMPAAWRGMKVEIVFEGVMTDTEVKVNGKKAGEVHQGGFYRFQYDISRLVTYGRENLLEVTVKNWSANPSVNTAERESDYWVFGGIYRPVYLRAYPERHISHAAIDAKADGRFTSWVYVEKSSAGLTVEGQVMTLDGQAVGAPFEAPVVPGTEKVVLQAVLNGISPWSPEFPHRYQVRFRLRRGTAVLHETSEKFGFRTVELRPKDGFYVNGAKIMFKGSNRHSFWPESGRTTSRELSEMDVLLMKEMNMNAVRMSHYPPDKHFLEVCDSLGLFVLDELAGWQTMYDTQVGRKLVKSMVMRDVNHPSVVIWDNGNEGGNNTDLDDDFHLYDPQQRPVIHPWAKFRDTDTNHYKPWDCCVDALFHGEEVFFPTELIHGLYDGGHGAGLEDYWTLMRQNPLSAGLFLWSFSDEGVVRVDEEKRIDTFGSDAPDGILGPFREKEGSFYTLREVWSPIYIPVDRLPLDFAGKLPVENRFHYTALNQCTMQWALWDLPLPGGSYSKQKAAEGNVPLPALKPGEQGILALALPASFRNHDLLTLTATDPHGREVFTWQWPLQSPEAVAQKYFSQKEERFTVRGTQAEGSIQLHAGDLTIGIDARKGTLQKVTHGSQVISLANGPVADSLFGSAVVKEVALKVVGNAQQVEVTFEPQSVMKALQYTLHPNGILTLKAAYLPKAGEYPYVGLSFQYPEALVNGAAWLGKGPYRVWKNRLRGSITDVWEKGYNNTVTGESGWEYPEFKGYHAGLYWAVIDNKEKPFALFTEQERISLHLFTPEKPKGAYNRNTDGSFPVSGNLSLMHAISPIGTKFMRPDQLGPQGRPNMVYYHGKNPTPLQLTLHFDFFVQE